MCALGHKLVSCIQHATLCTPHEMIMCTLCDWWTPCFPSQFLLFPSHLRIYVYVVFVCGPLDRLVHLCVHVYILSVKVTHPILYTVHVCVHNVCIHCRCIGPFNIGVCTTDGCVSPSYTISSLSLSLALSLALSL